MKKTIAGVIRSVIFIGLLLLSLWLINKYLEPKYTLQNSDWPTTSTVHQFYEMEKDSVDVLFLGSSVMVNSMSPQEIYNTCGIRSYNLGSEQQSIFLSYYWFKEALRFQSPKAVVVDLRFLFEVHPQETINTRETLTRKAIDPMQWSEVKREAVKDICSIDPAQSQISYYLTNVRYHGRWTDFNMADFNEEEYVHSELKGYSPLAEYGGKTYNTFDFHGEIQEKREMHPVMLEYMNRMVDACKERGIRLILISLPGSPMGEATHNACVAYAEEKGLDYYNMCTTELYNEIGATLPRENTVSHSNLWGSIKLSDYMGKLLSEKYGVPSVKDEQYESTKGYYEQIKADCELPHVTDINTYLDMLIREKDRYTIFVVSTKDAAAGLTEEVQAKLSALGLKTRLKRYTSYAALVDPRQGVLEASDPKKAVNLSGTFRDQSVYYSMTGSGYYAGSTSSVVVAGTEYSKSVTGLTFVIYENSRMRVLDAVSFNTATNCKAYR